MPRQFHIPFSQGLFADYHVKLAKFGEYGLDG